MLAEAAPYRYAVALGGVVLLTAAAVPPLGPWLEATLLRHMLVQIPMLVAAGAAFGWLLAARRQKRQHGSGLEGVPAILLAVFCIGFWMLPRWLDAAVADPLTDLAKITTLTALAGVPLGWTWSRLPSVAKAFILANAVSMLAVLSWIYLSYPARLCNAYLIGEQAALGQTMQVLAVALAGIGAGAALVGNRRA